MISKELLEEINKLNILDTIELYTIMNEKCIKLKKEKPHYRILKYYSKNRVRNVKEKQEDKEKIIEEVKVEVKPKTIEMFLNNTE